MIIIIIIIIIIEAVKMYSPQRNVDRTSELSTLSAFLRDNTTTRDNTKQKTTLLVHIAERPVEGRTNCVL